MGWGGLGVVCLSVSYNLFLLWLEKWCGVFYHNGGPRTPGGPHLTSSCPSLGAGWVTWMTSEPPMLMYSRSVSAEGRWKDIS